MSKGWKQIAIFFLLMISLSVPALASSEFYTERSVLDTGSNITFVSSLDIHGSLRFENGSNDLESSDFLILGPIGIDIANMDSVSKLPEDGFREKQFILQTSGPPDIEVLSDLDGVEFLDVLSWNSFLVEGSSRVLTVQMEENSGIRAISRYHSSMVIDGSLYQFLEKQPDDRSNDIVFGTYHPLGVESSTLISSMSEKPLISIDPYNYFASLSRDQIAQLAVMPDVSHISPLLPEESDNDIAAQIMSVKETWSTMGLNGTGQTIAVADTGLDTGSNSTIHQDFSGRITAAYAYGRTGNWSDPDIHVWDSSSSSWSYKGGHGTHVAGSVLGDGSASSGNYSGISPSADLVMQSTMASSGSLSIPAYSRLFGDAYRSGARIHTNSWSSRSSYGNYSWRSWQIDNFIWGHKDLLVLFSAGNKGSLGQYSVSTQSSSKNVISVGASENYRPSVSSTSNNISQMASFSSQGFTWGDGRIKPDVVAPGTWILSTRASTISDFWNHYWGSNTTYAGVNSKYAYMGGTSMSTPLVAGMSGLVRQYFEENESVDDPSAALIKASVINGARPLNDDWSSIPNRYEGWGRVNLSNSLATPDSNAGDLFFEDNTTGLSTGNSHTRTLSISGKGADLIMTLVWSDYPGSNTSSSKLVNDLDLVVTAPDGTEYHGNDLTDPFDSSYDRNNNVERIRIPVASAGLYNVTVKGFSVTKGPQPYALVATGDETKSMGTVGFERQYTPSNGTSVGIFLTDTDLNQTGSVKVKVNSTSDQTGEIITLNEIMVGSRGTGIFRGSVKITNGSQGPGEIHVSGDEEVFVHYDEDSPDRMVTSSVMALDVPEIFDITHDSILETLTRNEGLILYLNGTKEKEVTFNIIGLDGMYGIISNDMGLDHDEFANDGIYTGNTTIPDEIIGNFTLEGIISRPNIGSVSSRSDDIVRINTNIPVRPYNISVEPVPVGNSLLINWDSLDESEITSYSIYRANETFPGSGISSDMVLVERTMDNLTVHTDKDLVDGQIYFYSITALNVLGLTSSRSDIVSGIPFDTSSPWVEWNDPVDGDVLSGIVELNLTLENDTSSFVLQASPDSDGNGYPDSIWRDLAEFNNITPIIEWDTSELNPNIWEGKRVLLRIKAFDEMMNMNITDVLASISFDNTPPNKLSIDSERNEIVNVSKYHLSGTTESRALVQVVDEEVVILEFQAGQTGDFSVDIDLSSGVNNFQVRVFDVSGNGPFWGVDPFYIVYDDIDPAPVILWSDNITSRSVQMDASNSYDPGPESILTGMAEYLWKITKDDEQWVFGYKDPLVDLKIPGVYNVELMVIDNAGNRAVSEIEMMVEDGIPPIIIPFEDLNVNEDEEIEIVPLVTDDDQMIQFSGKYHWIIDGPISLESEDRIFRRSFETPGSYQVLFEVSDTGGNRVNASFSITVNDITAPVVDAGEDITVVRGDMVTIYSNDTFDNFPGGSDLWTYSWNIETLDIQGNGDRLSLTANLLGDFRVDLEVRDASGNAGKDTMTLHVVSDGIPPYLLLSTPENGATNASVDGSLKLVFSEPMDMATIWNSVLIRDHLDVAMNKEMEWSEDMTTLTVIVDGFERQRTYRIEIRSTLTDLSGESINGVDIEFTIRDKLLLEDMEISSNLRSFDGNTILSLPARVDMKFSTAIEDGLFVIIDGESLEDGIRLALISEADGHYIVEIPDTLEDGIYSILLTDLFSVEGETFSGEDEIIIIEKEKEEGGNGKGGISGWIILLITLVSISFPLSIGIFGFIVFRRNRKDLNDELRSSEEGRSTDPTYRHDHHTNPRVDLYSGMGNDK